MLRAEVIKYTRTWLFWALLGASVAFLLAYSTLLLAMDRLGLQPLTAFDYLIGINNALVVNVLPLQTCLFMAFAFASEYQWRTVMLPLLEGRSRAAIVTAKVLLTVLVIVALMIVYFVFSLPIAFTLFGARPILLEDRQLSSLEAIARMGAALSWTVPVFALFGWLSLLLAQWFRHYLLATLLGFLTFGLCMLTSDMRGSPFYVLLRVPRLLAEVAHLESSDLATAMGTGALTWVVLAAVLLTALYVSFDRQDVILE